MRRHLILTFSFNAVCAIGSAVAAVETKSELRCLGGSIVVINVDALLFDALGTVVDWQGGMIARLTV